MSRKKASKGYIKFTGLRFFLQKTEGRVSRKELVEFIKRFFTSRGLAFDALRVEFKMTRRPTGMIDGKISSVAGLMHPGQHQIEIYLGALTFSMTPAEVMETIVHELDHEAWEREGKEFNDSLPSWYSPHEIRARRTGANWRRRYEARK